MDVFSFLGRKRQKEAAPPGQEVWETRARLAVTLPSLEHQLLSTSGGGTVLVVNPVFTRYIRAEGLQLETPA